MFGDDVNVITKTIFQLNPEQHHLIKPNIANRVIEENDAHVNNLISSFKERGFDNTKPIIVGSDGFIKAGHNRYFAAKKAKLPILVEINDDLDFLEQTKNDDIVRKWSTKDFIRTFSKQGIKSYVSLFKTVNSYPDFPIKIIIASAAKINNQANGNTFKDVRSGKFKYHHQMTPVAVEMELDEIQGIHDLMHEDNKPQHISMHVGLAYLWLKNQNSFDKNRFWTCLKKNSSLLCPQAGGTKANRKMLLEIYNKGKHIKLVPEYI